MDEAMQELFNSLSDKVRDLLIVENPDGSYKINGNKFQNALDASSSIEEDASIIEIFLRQSIASDSKWKNVKWERIEPYKDILIRICSEVGLKELQNPFLVFLPEFYRINPNANLTRDNLIDLNNSYATDNLSQADLMGKGRNGLDNVIFSKGLYDNENADKMIQYWNYLQDPKNLSKMNWKEVLNADLSNRINDVAEELYNITSTQGGKLTSSDNYLDRLFYTNDSKEKTNTQSTIEQILSAGSIGNNKTQRQPTKSQEVDKDTAMSSLAKEISNYANKYNLTEVELRAILTDVLNQID